MIAEGGRSRGCSESMVDTRLVLAGGWGIATSPIRGLTRGPGAGRNNMRRNDLVKRILISLPGLMIIVPAVAVASYLGYQKYIDKRDLSQVRESEWIDEVGSAKCGAYTKYGSNNVDLVSKELFCRNILANQVRISCALERDGWYSVFSTAGDGIKYRDCMLHLGVDL